MTSITDRASLEAMKRTDLQKLCKDHGLRANLKSEALIDLLLDVQPGTKQQPGRRSVSTRTSSRSNRTSSMIVHDIVEDEEGSAEVTEGEQEEQSEQSEPQEVPLPPPPRTRKAKETQFRLGVGRPLAAGGKGARAVTKSVIVSKTRKGKGSRSVKPSEATIVEEPGPETIAQHQEGELESTTAAQVVARSTPGPSSEIDTRVLTALKPLHEQLKSLKAELGQMQALKNEISQMRNQVADIDVWKQKVETLSTEVKELRNKAALADSLNGELQQLKELISAQRTSTPTSEEVAPGPRTPTTTHISTPNALSRTRAPALVSVAQLSTSPANPSSRPGIPPVLLGKRHRDSTGSNVTGVVEEGQESGLTEADLVKTVLRPNKKRPRISAEPDDTDAESSSRRYTPEGNGDAPRGASFTIFSGPEPDDSYVDPPPPTTPLPAFYTASTPPNNAAGPSRHRVTSTQDASENMPPFSFSFLPVPPTPGAGNPYSMPSFPYPEPPQSPTPVRDNDSNGFISNNRDRTDMFQAFGLPPPTRPRSRLEPTLRSQDTEMGQYLNPAAFDNRGPLEGGEARSEDASDTIKRTMYGTELEGDTRFGDFGLESVATDFNWTGSF
ncbi:hypothetical protein J3R30DRAFT_3445747 [Lentinula aciculospora]|uniref:Uncharacterized protein n=1 Tax=Lentinula aciculospora TaxID=153920 RepID=A0A9W9DUI6_9AGAR|nr:hypothetical protein J3R30DRAFT_3445747 [Lentinula aciculospora]